MEKTVRIEAQTGFSLSTAQKQGLYNPANEHDACGVGFVCNIHNKASHSIVSDGLHILENLTHRGATGADSNVGDGAGMMLQISDSFFREEAEKNGITLPEPGSYAVAHVFLPKDPEGRKWVMETMARVVEEEGQIFLGWREVPVDNSCLSDSVISTEPVHMHAFIGRGPRVASENHFERRLFILRKVISNTIYAENNPALNGYYLVSMSCRTVVYKGMFLAWQLGAYYDDLRDSRMTSALALVHQRFSTNTFPSWPLAHPYRMVAHNGEINTLRGNVNWMAARQASVQSELFSEEISKIWPISYEGQSDTACFDNALEFLVRGGYSLPHAMMMMIPEAWHDNPLMTEKRRDFYEYNAALMEPWDGPAAVCFTDGIQIGATLDRNGLRPARYVETADGRVILASEAGVLPVEENRIVSKKRLQPGRMLLIDLDQGRIISDEEIKDRLATRFNYRRWLDRTQLVLEDLPPVVDMGKKKPKQKLSLLDRQQAFGYSQEDFKMIMGPMAATGQEALGSMGTDTPIAALSDKPKPLFTYFKQNFAQVTNPPIDPIREEAVMSLVSFIGPRPNLFDLEGLSHKKRLEVRQPILTNGDIEKIRAISDVANNHFRAITLDMVWPAKEGKSGMRVAVNALREAAEKAVKDGYNIIILSDRTMDEKHVPIPALLGTAAVHHHLIRKGLRTAVGLVVETGEAREVHHFCVLAGYGAEAINPYLAFETLIANKAELSEDLDDDQLIKRFIKAVDKGILKVMSKMGISTYQSYCGAQIFDALGLKKSFVDEFFFGTATQIEGIDFDDVAEDTVLRHALAFSDEPIYRDALDVGGEYAYRMRGERHAWSPDAVAKLQHAVRLKDTASYKDYAELINAQAEEAITLRGLMRIKTAQEIGRTPVSIDEVESAKDIVKRFASGAMSFGSISKEAHTTLALAMNAIGAKSNTGEGGEEPARFKPLADGSSMRSAIKQVASGRFGVTAEYLVNADQIQIKVAQGAKPGEGGQLPGHKVDAAIAKVRHSTPGVGLISPPPHHDIYSIEDLAQLIYDLKNVNSEADISVKLVSEVGVGTVAAGVAKARADHIVIAGYDGGTGASPLTSIKHAGSPWELGLAETHQTLVLNNLRGRVAVQVDGGLKTGRDVIVGALLGADEFGFATAPLIAAGCIMMRKCHLNTCPVGVATQDPVLRARFKGTPEHVINYFFFVAEEVRELMAEMGITRFEDLVGKSDWLEQKATPNKAKASGLNLSRLFARMDENGEPIRHVETQDHHLESVLDRRLIAQAKPALEKQTPVRIETMISSMDRSTGAMLSGQVAKRYGHAGLDDSTIGVTFRGTAGQAFGAFLANGITFELAGEANDYVGKGLSGGRIIVRPRRESLIDPHTSIIMGNTVLYGAITGELYARGMAGERFAVRNSGAIAVVEGVGDHGCEYMTGGVVVVLGQTGRNFAAGMSGGVAYVLDEDGSFAKRCNLSMVDIEPIPAEDDLLQKLHNHGGDIEWHGRVDVTENMTHHDEERLHQLIAKHHHFTDSDKAKEILDNWDSYRAKFVKIMPVDYRRAMEELEAQNNQAAAYAVAGE